MKDSYQSQIQDLKRQMQHSKPYRGVIAERRIRMLKNQVDRQREKHFHGRPLLRNADDDFEEDIADVEFAPREQLLHASLSTLESLGRHSVALEHSYKHTGKAGAYPSELYLQGALWIGRNFVMVAEEMTEAIDFLRSRILKEITAISEDRSDPQRSANRLSLLAGSTVTEAVEITNRYKHRSREILQGIAQLRPGDYSAMSLFLQNLPIDSLLERPNLTSSYGAVESKHHRPPSGAKKQATSASRDASPAKRPASDCFVATAASTEMGSTSYLSLQSPARRGQTSSRVGWK